MRQGRGGDCRGKVEQSEEKEGGREQVSTCRGVREKSEKKERGRVKGQGEKWRTRTRGVCFYNTPRSGALKIISTKTY